MKYEIGGFVTLIIGIGLIRYSSMLGAVTVIIGASIMMKGKIAATSSGIGSEITFKQIMPQSLAPY
jgi:hypothetical protein